MKMEKSLSNIEKTLSGTSAKSGAATSVFASLSSAIGSLTAAVSAKSFNKKKADNILSFAENLVKIASTVDAQKVKGFSEFSEGVSKAFEGLLNLMNPKNLLKLTIGSKILFTGKKPVLKTIVEGLSKMFVDIDEKDLKKMKTGGEAIKLLGEGLVSLSKAMGAMVLIGLGAPLVLMGALVVRAVVGLFASLGKKAKAIKDGGEAMKSLGKGLVIFSAGLATIALATIIIGPQRIIGIIAVLALFAITFNLIGKASFSINRGARSLARMGLALWGFSAGLAMLMLAVMIATPKNVIFGMAALTGFVMLFWVIGKFAKEISQGALVMIIGMSIGLFFFSGALMILGAALKLYDWETLLMGVVVIGAMGGVFALLGKLEKHIVKGAAAMLTMGIGLAAFSIGLMLYGLAIKLILSLFKDDYLTAGLAAGGIILGLGLAFAGIGFLAGDIIAGALAVAYMGGGLIAFSLGIMLFGVAIKVLQSMFDDLVQAGLIAAGILLGMGLAFAAIGVVGTFILIGADAVIGMGAALIVLSLGIMIFGVAVKVLMNMFDNDLERAGMIGAVIIRGMGLVFSAVGLLIVPIALGSAGVLLMGSTLLVLSVGLMVFGGAIAILKSIANDDLDAVPDMISGILLGLSYAFSEAGLLIVPVILGSVALIVAGAALLTIGTGLTVFALAMKIFKDNDLLEKVDDRWDIKGMSALVSMTYHFKDIGKAVFSPWPWLGLAYSIGLGASLLLIGSGLLKAAKALQEIPDMNKFIDNLFSESGLIPSMAKAFGDIGDKYGGSLLSSFMGTDSVSMGIRTVRGLGGALKNIAGGIAAFANFKEFPVNIPDPKDPSKLVYGTVDIFGDVIPGIKDNLPGLLSVLADVFAGIGEKYGGGFRSDGPVQAGIDAVKGMGGVLSEIAGGIVAFANFEEYPVQVPDPEDPSKLIYKVVNLFDIIPKIQTALVGNQSFDFKTGQITGNQGILFSLAGVFASIAQRYPDGFLSDSDVQKGVEAVQGIGKEVSDLVGGIVKFANFEEFPVQIPDPSDPSKLVYKAVNMFDVIPKILKVLVGDRSLNVKSMKFEGNEGILLALAGVFAKIAEKYPDGFSSDSDVQAGVEAVQGIGSVVSELAGGIMAFADVERGFPEYDKDGKIVGYKPVDLVKIKNTIVSVISTIPDAFAKVDYVKIKTAAVQADKVADLMKPVSKIADAISKMFIDDKDKINMFDTLGASIAKFSSEIQGVKIEDEQIKMLNDLVKPLQKFSTLGDGLSSFADGLSKTGTAFGTFANGFNKFAASSEKFTKFEDSFSRLVKNQYQYKFDKFAEDMGKLQKNVNAFEIEKLQLADSMMKSMAIISKTPETLADRISETLEKSFEELVKAIKDLAKESVPETTPGPSTSNPLNAILPGTDKGKTGPSQTDAKTQAMMALLTESLKGIQTELQGINRKIVVTTDGIKVSTPGG